RESLLSLHKNVVIAGAGLMGHWHAYYAKQLGANIAAVVDVDQSQALSLAARYGSRTALDLNAALRNSDVDFVHICTPSRFHAVHVKECLSAGAHVLVEKPLAATLSETEDLLELARRNKLQLTPVHQFPFQTGFIQLKQRIHELGRPVR